MLNLNIGDVVYHAGTKRTIEAVKSVAGQTFFKLSSHAYMVRLDHVKPVIRLYATTGPTFINCTMSDSYDWPPRRMFGGLLNA